MTPPESIEQVEEIAIAVENADAAVSHFNSLFGLDFDAQWRIDRDHIRVRAATVAGTQVHFLEPTAEAGPVYSFLQAEGEGLHHVAFRVSDLDEMVSHLREMDARLTPDRPIDNEGSSYIFVHPSTARGVLVELIERPE